MKILYISSLYAPNAIGGAERVVQSLAEGAVEAGHQAVVVSLGEKKGVCSSWINDVKVYYVGIKNLYDPFREGRDPAILKPFLHALDTFNPLMSREIANILDEEHPDLVHTHTLAGFSVHSWRPVKQRGLPLVHTLHDYYLLCPKASMFRDGENCQQRCTQCLPYSLPRLRTSNLVDVVTGVSNFILRRHLEHGCFPEASDKKVIYNGFKVETGETRSSRRSLPIRFGYLGRLDPTKGLETLLASIKDLPEAGWSLEIGGKGPDFYVDGLRARYNSPDIKFLGYVASDYFFEEIDVLVVPSVWHEPSPRVISEAFAHGVPVIGSKRGGIPELVEDGRTGFLFDPGRMGELTSAMRRFIEHPTITQEMRPACLKRAKDLLPENITAKYLGVYAEAMDRR